MTVCKGCFIIKECDVDAMNSQYRDTCPCAKCLVKMICKETTCQDYNLFLQTIYHDQKFITNMQLNNREMRISQKLNILREESK